MLFKYFITVSIWRHIHPDIYIYSTTSAHRFVNFVKLRCCCQNQNLIAVLQLIYFCQERVHHLQVFAICRANEVNILKPKNNDLISCLTVLSLGCLKHLFNYINLLIASNQVFRLHHYRVLFDEPHLCEHLLNHQSLTDPLGPMDQHPFDPNILLQLRITLFLYFKINDFFESLDLLLETFELCFLTGISLFNEIVVESELRE